MKLFEDLKIKFEKPDWSRNPEFGLIDTILEQHTELYSILSVDITKGCKANTFGRKDTPSVEQIVRAAIYKELKGLDYRELEYHQSDSRICAQFVKIDELRPYSFQVYHKYISKISADNLKKFMYALNKIAVNEGLEDIERIRQDSTTVETNIHYPTNNALIWDCIKESHRLLSQLSGELSGYTYRDYMKSGKRTFYKINNTKGNKRKELFVNQLITFTKCINQVSNAIKKKSPYNSLKADCIIKLLEEFLPIMEQVYDVSYRKEVKGETIKNEEKIFSIYERHTDIIVKGGRNVVFGHKVDLCSGKSNLVLNCEVYRGNPSDTNLYQPMLEKISDEYSATPRDWTTDGGYASLDNQVYAKDRGIENIVFNKVVGSLKNQVSSLNMETRLKKWRSGMEAVISNIKRGFQLFRCNWKGWEHFVTKVLWSVIAYNIRVMTALIVQRV